MAAGVWSGDRGTEKTGRPPIAARSLPTSMHSSQHNIEPHFIIFFILCPFGEPEVAGKIVSGYFSRTFPVGSPMRVLHYDTSGTSFPDGPRLIICITLG